MGLFNKKEKAEGAAKSTSPAPPSPTEDGQPKTRQPYVPRHAARDGMIGAPTGWNAEEQNVVRLENRRRDLERQASGFSLSPPSNGHGDIRAPPSPGFSSHAHMSRQLSEMSLDSKLAAASGEHFSRSSSYLSVNSEASSSRLSGGDWAENNNKPKVQKSYFSHGMDKSQLARSPLSTPATSVDITPDTSESGSIDAGLPREPFLEKLSLEKLADDLKEMRPTAPRKFVTPATNAPLTPQQDKTAAAAEKPKSKWMKRMTRSASPEEAK